MNPSIQRITLSPTQAINQSNIAFGAAGGAVRLCTANDRRQFIRIENTGLSSMWYGASSNATTGATGNNIGSIATAGNVTIEGFAGELYGVFTGLSHATGHVVKVFEY